MKTASPVLHSLKLPVFLLTLTVWACKTNSRENLLSSFDSQAVLECSEVTTPELLRDREVLFRVTGQKNCRDLISALGKIEYLNLDNMGLYSTSLLKPAASLKILSARNNYIGDTKGLRKLRELRELNLDNNKINDVSDLSELKNLEQLYLSHNKIKFVRPISNLKNLIVLTLNSNQISDFSELELREELLVLEIRNNPIDPETCKAKSLGAKKVCEWKK